MSESDLKEALLTLVKDTNEHLKYLKELGVENAEDMSGVGHLPAPAVLNKPEELPAHSVSGRFDVLERNASAASRQEPNAIRKFIEPSRQTLDPQYSTLFGDVESDIEATRTGAAETLENVWKETRDCTRCPLWEGRTHVVNSEGNPRAQLMFVGEAPGADEDAQARPFVGRAGQLLNNIIESIGLKREDVFIGNVNRCRPPQNRTPTPTEGVTCKPFIIREIDIVQPKVIVVLGNVAMKNLLDTKEGITKLRGKFQDYGGIKVMPTFHPAYLLRDPSKKRETWEDMKTVRDYLNSVAPGK